MSVGYLLSLRLPLSVPGLLALLLVGDLDGTRLPLNTSHQARIILIIVVLRQQDKFASQQLLAFPPGRLAQVHFISI